MLLEDRKGITSKERQCDSNEGDQDNVHGPVYQPGEEPIGNPAFGELDQLVLNHVIDWHGIHLQASKTMSMATLTLSDSCPAGLCTQLCAAMALSCGYDEAITHQN